MRFGFVIAYDGTHFHGSQIQARVRTIQGEIEETLANIYVQPVRVRLASRTDTGVHAECQVGRADVDTEHGPETFIQVLNHNMADDLRITSAGSVSTCFDPRRDALIAFVGSISLGLFFFAPDVVTVFGMKGKSVDVGAMALRILSVGLLMESARRVVAGAFQGSGKTNPPMFVEGIVRWAFQLPVAFLMAAPLGVGAASIWLAISGSQILSGMTMVIWFFLWARRGGLASCSETLSAGTLRSGSD